MGRLICLSDSIIQLKLMMVNMDLIIEIMNNYFLIVEAQTVFFCPGLVVCEVNCKTFYPTVARRLLGRRRHQTHSNMAPKNYVLNTNMSVLICEYINIYTW